MTISSDNFYVLPILKQFGIPTADFVFTHSATASLEKQEINRTYNNAYTV